MIDLLSMDQSDMETFLIAHGFPKFRGKQLYQWLHKQEVFSFDAMTNLPKDLKSFLKANTYLSRGILKAVSPSKDGETVKFLLQFGDDLIETVMMHYHRKNARDRNTLCVSTQVGCGMGCKFCATGQGGLKRNLTVGEIVDQVNFANEYLREAGESPISNLVYMGMGEPFANYDAMLKSICILNDAKEIGMRRITVSTCGLIPEIQNLAAEKMQLILAVSLHGASDEIRTKLMPINKRYPLKELMAALDHYIKETGRRVTLEYALFQGINDRDEDAKALVEILKNNLYHVNLVPGNPVDGTGLRSSAPERIKAFLQILESGHIPVSIRESKGRDIDGACGQLRAKYQKFLKKH